jgi:two-component system, chemotaxis family, protein-glutamate methylesterase/glutaminase
MEKDKIVSSFKVLVIGGSAGSLDVILKVLPHLDETMKLAIVIVLHRKSGGDYSLSDLLSSRTRIKMKEIEDKQALEEGCIYIAPPDYHLLFEKDRTLSLDYSEKVNYSRPSIDVSFESASEIFGSSLTCLLLSGANADGVKGLSTVKQNGGQVTAQDPATADSPFMPQQAILNVPIDKVLNITEMAAFINAL